MRSLADIQAGFIGGLTNPSAPVPVAVGKKAGVPAKRRFDVYRNNVVVGLIEALRATFPAVDRLVGTAFFGAAANVYLETEPPRSPLLFRYGGTFGNFLDAFPPAASVPYLGDVARLEWVRLEAYHAENRQPIVIEGLATVPEAEVGKATFELHPSLALIKSPWPVFSLWAASTDQGGADDVDMDRAEQVLVIRPELDVDTRLLPDGGFEFMKALRDRATLERAAISASEIASGFDLATHLQGLFEVGAVTKINP